MNAKRTLPALLLLGTVLGAQYINRDPYVVQDDEIFVYRAMVDGKEFRVEFRDDGTIRLSEGMTQEQALWLVHRGAVASVNLAIGNADAERRRWQESVDGWKRIADLEKQRADTLQKGVEACKKGLDNIHRILNKHE